MHEIAKATGGDDGGDGDLIVFDGLKSPEVASSQQELEALKAENLALKKMLEAFDVTKSKARALEEDRERQLRTSLKPRRSARWTSSPKNSERLLKAASSRSNTSSSGGSSNGGGGGGVGSRLFGGGGGGGGGGGPGVSQGEGSGISKAKLVGGRHVRMHSMKKKVGISEEEKKKKKKKKEKEKEQAAGHSRARSSKRLQPPKKCPPPAPASLSARQKRLQQPKSPPPALPARLRQTKKKKKKGGPAGAVPLPAAADAELAGLRKQLARLEKDARRAGGDAQL